MAPNVTTDKNLALKLADALDAVHIPLGTSLVFIGLAGNVFALLTIRRLMRANPPYIYQYGLIVSDIVFLFAYLFIGLYTIIAGLRNSPFGPFFLLLWLAAHPFNLAINGCYYFGIFLLGVCLVDRIGAIRSPMAYLTRNHRRRFARLAAAAAAASLLIRLPSAVINLRVRPDPANNGSWRIVTVLSEFNARYPTLIALYNALLILVFLAVFPTIAALSIRLRLLFKATNSASLALQSKKKKSLQSEKKARAERALSQLLLLQSCILLLGIAPKALNEITRLLLPKPVYLSFAPLLWGLTRLGMLVPAVFNVFVYAAFNPEFRRNLRRLVSGEETTIVPSVVSVSRRVVPNMPPVA